MSAIPVRAVQAESRLPSVEVAGYLAARSPTAATAVLAFQNVTKWYGPVIGLNDLSLTLRGGITGLVGANGAGKSTLLRLAAGHLRPDAGSVTVAGMAAWSWQAKPNIGYCSDVDAFYEEMSGAAFVEAMARLCGFSRSEAKDRTADAVRQVGMEGRATRKLGGYSKGMRQRVKLAAALIHDPPLLVLDEPLAGVDPVGRREFLELFRDLAGSGKCLLISSHELEALEQLTDHVAIMGRGRLAAVGTLTEIRDLLEDQPLAVRVDCDRPRELATRLIGWPEVVGVDAVGGQSLVVRARNPRRFFTLLGKLVVECELDVSRLEPLDDSAHAILGYLLGGSGRT